MPTQIAIPNSVVLYFATALSESLFQGIILSQLSTYLATSACMRGTTPLGPQAKDSISSPRLININRTTDGWDRDRWWGLRGYTLLVFFVCALETAFQIVRCWTFIENAAEWPRHIMRTSEISTNVIVTVLVQAFFINRCWKASKNIFILAYLTLLVLGQIAISVCMTVALRGEYGRIVYGGKVAQDQDGHRNFIIWEPTILIPFFALVPVLVDLSITIILIMYFKRWRTGLPASDALLRHVSYLAFEAAALPTLARLAAGVGWLAKAHSLAVVCGMLPAKLYVISYLRALNARPKLRERAHAVHGRETLGTEDDTVEFTLPWHTDTQHWASPVVLRDDDFLHLPRGGFATNIEPAQEPQMARMRMPRSNTMDSERELTFIEALAVTQPGEPLHQGRRAASRPHPSQLAVVSALPILKVDMDEEQTCESRRSSEATCIPLCIESENASKKSASSSALAEKPAVDT